MRLCRWVLTRVALILAVLSGGTGTLRGQTAWFEGFESPQPTWREVGGNVQYRVESHQRVQGVAHTGRASEWLRISGSGAGYVHFAHPVGRPRVIDELLPSVWIKADRPGLQLLIRVVLPRARDPRSGSWATVLLAGSSYTMTGTWQQLRVDNVPQLLSAQARLLQQQLSSNLDVREAYVDHVFLNVYGGPGITNVWIDDLDIAGFVESAGLAADRISPGFQAAAPNPALGATVAGREPSNRPSNAAESPDGARVLLAGPILQVDGRPMFPRIVQYQGESLSLLKQLGFNAISLPGQGTAEVLEEANRLGLWVVCAPPLAAEDASSGGAQAPTFAIGPGFDRVLAWDLGAGLTRDQCDATRRWAEQVRAADRRNGRPLFCRPTSEIWEYSRCVDLLLVGRSPLGTSLELADYGTWLRERPRLARAGTPLWNTVQTQPARSLLEQWAVLGRGETSPATVANEQIRLLVYTAITAGSRGMLFESESPLDANDPDARSRATALELLNLELDLVEPFAAAGQAVATVNGSEPEVVAALLRTDRARLLVPIWSAPGAQYVSGQAAAHGVSFVVPGVPESNRAYELTPGALKPLHHKLVTGGMRVTLDEFGLTSLVLLTQDPLVVNAMTKRATAAGPRAAELQRQLAADKLRLVELVHARLASRSPVPQAAEWLAVAKKDLQWADGLLAARDYPGAYASAHRAMRPLRLLERAHWQAAVRGIRSPVASPAAVFFRTLPWHQGMMDYVAGSQWGANLLAGGDFENLETMLQAGWRHFQHPTTGAHGESDLATVAAHSGRLGLRLSARSTQRENLSMVMETPPVWITSPGVPVEPGALVRIQGWVQVPAPITGSVDGLMILDSLTGEPLAERIDATAGWTPFTLYRVAPQSGRVAVTFALSGLGEAMVDDVTIQLVQPPSPKGVTNLPRVDGSLR